MRTKRSDLTDKTGVNLNAESLLAPWLDRHCAWSLTRFAIDTDGQNLQALQPAKEIHKSMCQGVENGFRPSSIERNSQTSHVQWRNKKSWDEWLRKPDQLISLCKWNKHNNNVR